MHWRAARLFAFGELQGAQLVAMPYCFVYRCKRYAVTIVRRYD